MEHIVYLLTRNDGKLYIGTTTRRRYNNRMCQHKCSRRFAGHTFTHTILFESDELDEVLRKETELIAKHNTLAPSGLNLTWSGKGKHHNSIHFTTRGYQFSSESRAKMSAAAKERTPRVGWKHRDETKQLFSEQRKGKVFHRKLDPTEVIALYNEHPAVPGEGKSKNGKEVSYLWAFCRQYAPHFGVSPQGIKNVLRSQHAL